MTRFVFCRVQETQVLKFLAPPKHSIDIDVAAGQRHFDWRLETAR